MLFRDDAFKDRVVLVTGASRGIGQTVAQSFATLGATVVGTATSDAGVAKIVEALQTKGTGLLYNALDKNSAQALVDATLERFGRIDVLVNNAGITRDMLSMRLSDENWEDVLNANLSAAFRLARAVIRPMMKARFGRLINMSSVVGFTGNPGQANYAASKAGLVAMSKSIAREVASRGITVNCVAPGFVQTDMTAKLSDAQKEAILKTIPVARLGTTQDIANAVLYLASVEAGYVTGTTVHVNGGLMM